MAGPSGAGSAGTTVTLQARAFVAPAVRPTQTLRMSLTHDAAGDSLPVMAVEQLPDEPVSQKSTSLTVEAVQARSQKAHQAALDKLSSVKQNLDAKVEETTLKNAKAVQDQIEQISHQMQAAIPSVSLGDAGPEGQAAARQLAEQIAAHKDAQAQLCQALLPAFEAEQAERERQLIAALEVMACQMMEAGVIRQDALQRLLCKETELLAASAADDRSTIQDLVKLLQEDVERKAAEAHEAGKQAIAAWREAQTKQLLDTFKAKMQDGDFASLPQFRQAISSIGTAQHELRLALTQHLGALPDAARQEDASCAGWKAKTDGLLSDWQAQSTAGMQQAATHADAALQSAGCALATLSHQVKDISSLSQEDIMQLIGAEAQPEVDRLASYFQNVQRCMAGLLESQTASCLQTCKAMADLLQDAGQCCADVGTSNTVAVAAFDSKLKTFQQESQDLHEERKLEAALDAVQSAATEQELQDRVLNVSTEQASLTASLEARRAQLDILVTQLQQQLTDDSNAGLKTLYGFLGLREIVDNESSGTELQMVPENGKPTSIAPAMTRSSKSSKTLDNRQPSASVDAKGRRLSQQDPIVEALQILDVGNSKFEITSSLMARFAPDQPAEAEPESPRNTKPTGAKQSGQKAEVSKVAAAASQGKTKGKAAAAKTEADEPQKPSMEDEARQLLPTGADGQPMISLDILLAQSVLEEAIKQWQTALVERALDLAEAARAAASERSAQAQAANAASIALMLTQMSAKVKVICGEVKNARVKELKAQQRSLTRHHAAQGRARLEHQQLLTKRIADLNAKVHVSMKLLTGLPGQLSSCQTLQGIQMHCQRGHFLKDKIHRDVGDGLQTAKQEMAVQQQQQLLAADESFQQSLPRFVLNHGGWSDASLETAAAGMEQLMLENNNKSQAILDEGLATLDQLKSRASDVAAEIEAAVPVHRRDLAFLVKLDKAQQSAGKACQLILEGSRSRGIETATLLRALQDGMLGFQGQSAKHSKLADASSHPRRATSPRTHSLHAAQSASPGAPATSGELMEAAEKLRLALLKEAISLEMLASTGLASSLADGEKVANNTASSPARKEADGSTQKGAAAAKATPGTAAASAPSIASASIVQQITQELTAYTEAVQKACSAYYGPPALEQKAPAGQSKTKTAKPVPAASGLEAVESLPPTSEGPGAITRPALIMPTAAEMERQCCGKVEVQRSVAQAHVMQASETLQAQVVASEQLLLKLPEKVLSSVATEAGASAQQGLQDLLKRLLGELEASMQPAAARRNQLHPTMAWPGRRAELDDLQTQELDRSVKAKGLLREHASSALQAASAQAEVASQKLEHQAVAIMRLLDDFPLPADLCQQQSGLPAASAAAVPEPAAPASKAPAQKAFDWDESDEYFTKLPQTTALPEPSAAKVKGSAKALTPGEGKGSTAAGGKPPAAVPKPGKQPAIELVQASPGMLSLNGYETMMHAAVGPAFTKACEAVHGQVNACVSTMKQSFTAAAAEEDANAARWKECMQWLQVPFA